MICNCLFTSSNGNDGCNYQHGSRVLSKAGTATANDGGTAARSNTYGNGYGLGITASYDALTIGAYVAERDNKNPTTVADVRDEFNGTWFAKYNFGPVSIGYQKFMLMQVLQLTLLSTQLQIQKL